MKMGIADSKMKDLFEYVSLIANYKISHKYFNIPTFINALRSAH